MCIYSILSHHHVFDTRPHFKPAKKPVVGRVSCGFPSPALEYYEPPLSIDELVSLREPSRWLLRADGDSLGDIGIYDGDVLVVVKALEPLNGDISLVVTPPPPIWI